MGHALNHSQFQDFLEFCDLPYHITVRWLRLGKFLFRFPPKNRDDPLLSDATCLSQLSFLVYITFHMHELNLKLQGNDDRICFVVVGPIIVEGSNIRLYAHRQMVLLYALFKHPRR